MTDAAFLTHLARGIAFLAVVWVVGCLFIRERTPR